MDDRQLFFIDAECDGLYGPFISVAIIVTDKDCVEQERFYYGIDKSRLNICDDWTRKHVLPILGEYEPVADENELLDRVWEVWCRYREHAYAIGDVIFPVEARLFSRCVEKNPKSEMYNGPFPFLDLSSLLYAHGMDPLNRDISIEHPELQHNALSDVEEMIRTYQFIMSKVETDGRK